VTKGPLAFRTISETADHLGVPQHVLRFWETKFTFIRPTKRAGGRRFYRPQDVDILTGVKHLLHDRGYTIRGVQKLYKDLGQKAILSADNPDIVPTPLPETEIDMVTQVALIGEDSLPPDAPKIDLAEVKTKVSPLSDVKRARFLEIAEKLETAQKRLGHILDRK
jgi:DNA-binding transcriptional MerR regulator